MHVMMTSPLGWRRFRVQRASGAHAGESTYKDLFGGILVEVVVTGDVGEEGTEQLGGLCAPAMQLLGKYLLTLCQE